MIVVPEYRGFRIEVNAVAVDERHNTEVRILRLFARDKPHVETVTWFKMTPRASRNFSCQRRDRKSSTAGLPYRRRCHHDREHRTGAFHFLLGCPDLPELLEHRLLILRGDADPGVAH